MEFIIENFPRKKTPGKMNSLVNCGKNLKRNTNPYIKSLSRGEKNPQFKAHVTLIPTSSQMFQEKKIRERQPSQAQTQKSLTQFSKFNSAAP